MADASVETKAAAFAAEANASVSDFVALLKPRVMSLAVFTALTGLVAAPGHIHPVLAVIAILCIAAGAGACGSLNMWYDADIDAKMARTAGRPIPRGRITGEEAFAFGIVLAIISVMTLGLIVNWTAGALLALTIAFYVLVYTMWLKRRTPQNIVIGGAAGALPPMIGWASVTGSISADSALLFLIIFLWTPPHFWALALYRCRDYQRAQVPMLPVTAGPDATRRQILLYSLLLVPIGVAPALTGLGGAVYLAVSVLLGIAFVALATEVFIRRKGLPANRAAQRLFSFSILYLFLLFAVLLAEHAGRFWLP